MSHLFVYFVVLFFAFAVVISVIAYIVCEVRALQDFFGYEQLEREFTGGEKKNMTDKHEFLRFPLQISDFSNLVKEKLITKKDIEKYDVVINIDYLKKNIVYNFVKKQKKLRSLAVQDNFDFNFDDFQDAVEYLKDLAKKRLSE